MKLDYSALEKALAQFEKCMDYLHSDVAKQDPDMYEICRGATIKAFEFTYVLAVKMIRRQLEQIVDDPAELKEIVFMDLMRSAADAGLVREALHFRKYRDERNKTSHAYDAKVAESIVTVFDGFLQDMRFLLGELRRRNP